MIAYFSYGLLAFPQINGQVVTSDEGFRVDLRRRRVNGEPVPSLYGGDVDEVVFEVSYHTNQALSFAVNTSH